MDLERCQVEGLASAKSSLCLQYCDFAGVVGVFMEELLDDALLNNRHVALHHLADSDFVPDIVKHLWEV